ncbi:MAG: GNAT family N-acetyltransferase [Candidatus Methanomethylophilaceae archaeon]|nr:GNAT family N-acetyltransferase [Candidatus Methanomethylophilaceae archaeon]
MTMICIPADHFEDDVIELYESSFTPIEKVPISNLERAMERGAALDVFRDKGALIGFTYSFIDDDKMFFIYFATSPEVRGRGYGKRILRIIREKYSDKRMFLITEPKDRDAPDYEMRVRRQNYYLRNGCEETGVKILSDDAWFDSMFMQGRLTDQEMIDIVRRYEDIHNGRR